MEEQRGDPSHQEGNSEDSDNNAAGTWYYKGEPVAQNNKAWRKPFAHRASSSVDQESQKNTEATWDHYLHISPDTSHYMEAVFSMVRKICGKTTWRSYGRFECEFCLFGECSRIPLFEQQFISEKTMTRIYITRRTTSGTLWDNYLVK